MIKHHKNLQQIPGIGKIIANDFYKIGIKTINDLQNQNPDTLYNKLCDQQKTKVDKCMLYVCRSSIYFANHEKHNQEKLKWWNWKDEK